MSTPQNTPNLVIANKKYSSWSLRAWIALAHADAPFSETMIKLRTPGYKEALQRHSPNGLAPALVDGDIVICESVAILEYLNETHVKDGLLPKDVALRAEIRAAAARMHAGFTALRGAFPMNLARAPSPIDYDQAVADDIAAVLSLWETSLEKYGGPFLFGDWSMADCMYLPVVTRFNTYAVDVSAHPLSKKYMDRMLELPAFKTWRDAGVAETEVIEDYMR